MNREICGFPSAEWIVEFDSPMHWTGFAVSYALLFSLKDDAPALLHQALQTYISGLSLEERQERRARFDAYVEGVSFITEFWQWLIEKVGARTEAWEALSDDKRMERVHVYVCGYADDLRIAPDQLTEAVPVEIRKRFRQAVQARDAWRQWKQARYIDGLITSEKGRVVSVTIEETPHMPLSAEVQPMRDNSDELRD